MRVDPIVSMAINAKLQSVQEQVSMRVAKLALDMMEQSGDDINRLLGDMDISSLDRSLGNIVDISV